MNYAMKERLRLIDCLVQYQGHIFREPIMAFFGISSAAATRDLHAYITAKPNNLVYRPSEKRYVKASSFSPLFDNNTQELINE